MNTDRDVTYKLFGLIKDVTETTETKKVRRRDILIETNTIKRRHIKGTKISWVLSTSYWSYTKSKDNKQ